MAGINRHKLSVYLTEEKSRALDFVGEEETIRRGIAAEASRDGVGLVFGDDCF